MKFRSGECRGMLSRMSQLCVWKRPRWAAETAECSGKNLGFTRAICCNTLKELERVVVRQSLNWIPAVIWTILSKVQSPFLKRMLSCPPVGWNHPWDRLGSAAGCPETLTSLPLGWHWLTSFGCAVNYTGTQWCRPWAWSHCTRQGLAGAGPGLALPNNVPTAVSPVIKKKKGDPCSQHKVNA